MKNPLLKLKEKQSLLPIVLVEQTKIKKFPIYHINIASEVDCKALAKFLLDEKNKLETTKRKPSINLWRLINVIKGWHSDYTVTDEYSNTDFINLCNIVKNKVEKIFPEYSYVIDHFWFAIYNNNDSAKIHDHGSVDIAIVFYPEVPANSSSLSIVNANGDFNIPISTGSLVIFPGEVSHYVKPSQHNNHRMAISMNLYRDTKNKHFTRS